MQGQAEYYLEKLHGEVEKQLELFLKNQKTGAEWRKFRETLIGLTDVTHSHFAKLVQVSLLLKGYCPAWCSTYPWLVVCEFALSA